MHPWITSCPAKPLTLRRATLESADNFSGMRFEFIFLNVQPVNLL